MNTEQIIKALECFASDDDCVGRACSYFTVGCEKIMAKDALALIKELQAHNENLKKENKYLRERLAEEAEIKEDMKGK